MMYKIGLTMLGLACVACFVSAGLLAVFQEQLIQAYPTPPTWAYCVVAVLCISGGVGFTLALISLVWED